MYIWCQDNQSELSFLLLSQCARSKRNVKSLNGSYYTTVRLHFKLRIGKKVKKFKPFGQTPPLPQVTEQHPRYPLRPTPTSGALSLIIPYCFKTTCKIGCITLWNHLIDLLVRAITKHGMYKSLHLQEFTLLR